MSQAEKLKKKFGGNLNESLGARTKTSGTPASSAASPATTSPDDGRTRERAAGHMEIDRIVPDPNQPRKEFDTGALDRLAASLKRHGQLLPVRVRWNEGLEKWVIISGERRYQAAKRAGLPTLACVFIEKELSTSEVLQEQVIENLLREDLKPIEQAKAYKTLMEMNSWNGSQLAEALNVSKATVSRVLALLKLSDSIQEQVNSGEIPSTAAYEVAKLPTPEAQQAMAERIVSEDFTRRDAIEAIRGEVEPQPAVPPPSTEPSANPKREFRGETSTVADEAIGQANPAPEFRGETQAEGTTTSQTDAPDVAPAAPARKPGKPRTGTKERAYRVDGARITVTFLKKVPTAAEVVAALEEALTKARDEATKQSAA